MTETAQENLLKSEFGDAGWQAERLLEAMDQAPDFYFQAVQQIKMSKWSNSRVVCLGDTAYVPTPLTGMGTFASHQRCHVLAGELSKLHEGSYPSTSLEAYETTFRPYDEEVQKIPSFIPAIVHPETATKRWLVQTLLSTLTKAAAIPLLANRLPPGQR